MKNDRQSDKNTPRRSEPDRLFRTISIAQICIHLCAYIAAFVKLIIIEAGGYYDTGVMSFLGITLVSMPLFAIALWLIQNRAKLSKSIIIMGYCFNLGVSIWSIWIIIKVGYLIPLG
ncbi:hypothetical protein [Chamaesiphon sp. GL140_3_metabinner_50]|uniref:hypothetical protein n=1 Tax=Chamaesiphon sp. GL140_3_metabinner_50 TaxID=2970812 RepID=UPI0025FFA70C|nr:hypothetical protein [Chamaesiphon sp. GL140_3_metabinner_50]